MSVGGWGMALQAVGAAGKGALDFYASRRQRKKAKKYRKREEARQWAATERGKEAWEESFELGAKRREASIWARGLGRSTVAVSEGGRIANERRRGQEAFAAAFSSLRDKHDYAKTMDKLERKLSYGYVAAQSIYTAGAIMSGTGVEAQTWGLPTTTRAGYQAAMGGAAGP